jgi:catalase
MKENENLKKNTERSDGQYMTTNHGVRIEHTDDSLKAGERGPTLMEDFHFREKLTHFDHERIPERIVHARGTGAHGYFEVYESQSELTKAAFLQDPGVKTPVFVRFSTVVGFRGSADTVRDARGFATKFYTSDGNFDLVGNNMPVFFIQDGIKFPDLVHSIKPEPHHEMPQASAAHDNFWDFISLMPESMHMIMWVLSHRGVPRSYSMMEGFGVHTFRLINPKGEARFVKFHWKPILGVHSLEWDEAQKIAGKDPDFNRRQVWETLESGKTLEYELGLQVIEEKDEFAFDFDVLDATKIWPEELVPVKIVGKMTLDRNPDNFFAETEQVAFHPGHIVPGIDFTNDPLLQARLFSYLDTQLIRLGGPNFAEIPINRPHVEVHNNQRDGYMRQTINKGRTNYSPNSLGRGCPMMSPESAGGFVHHMEKVDGTKIRKRSESFKDHFSQARLFYNSMSAPEKKHILEAFQFELGKVESLEVRQRMIGLVHQVDSTLAEEVAHSIGVDYKASIKEKVKEVAEQAGKVMNRKSVSTSPALSIENTRRDSVATRKIAFLISEGFDHNAFDTVKKHLESKGAMAEAVSNRLGEIKSSDGHKVMATKTYQTTASVLYDGVFVPGGDNVEQMHKLGDAIHFIQECYRHYKPVGGTAEANDLIRVCIFDDIKVSEKGVKEDKGVVTTIDPTQEFLDKFEKAIAMHRHYVRKKELVPA